MPKQTMNKPEPCQYRTIIKTESGLHRTYNKMKNSIARAVLKSNGKIVETCKIDNIYTHINDRSLFLFWFILGSV
jgi:hypothetical protein